LQYANVELALRICAVKSIQAATDLGIGEPDDVAERNIRVAINHLKDAAKRFNQIKDANVRHTSRRRAAVVDAIRDNKTKIVTLGLDRRCMLLDAQRRWADEYLARGIVDKRWRKVIAKAKEGDVDRRSFVVRSSVE
jgi:DNA polymerase III delta prime subunit